MTVLGPLKDEPPEPMTKEAFDAIRQRLRTSWNGSVTLEKKTVEALIQEIIWLKKRLHRVESAIQPLVEELQRYAKDACVNR
jgi:vacuolar-type H+-ATPase subunit D/Vma8